MFRYSSFGLSIASEVPFPELPAADTSSVAPDVTIRTASLGVTDLETKYHRLTPEEICFSSPDVGTLLVQNGSEILVDPLDDVEDSTLRIFVLGPAFGALMHQRGKLVLHGSALSIGGRAVALLGPSRAGKSTTAAALARRGHGVLTDDLVVVDEGSPPTVRPGFPALKLTERTVGTLDLSWPSIATSSVVGKRYYRTDSSIDREPRPLHTVYLLTVGDEQRIERVDGTDAMVALVAHSYAAGVLKETESLSSNFRQCSRLVDDVRVRRVQRTDDIDAVADLVASIERDCRARAP